MRRIAVFILLAVAAGSGIYWMVRLWPQPLGPAVLRPVLPIVELQPGRTRVRIPGQHLVGEAGRFRDEFLSYLMLQYWRGRREVRNSEVLLSYEIRGQAIEYLILIRPENDLLTGIPVLAGLAAAKLSQGFRFGFVDESALRDHRFHTRVIETAYNLPPKTRLEKLAKNQLTALVRRFVRFKSSTDGRVRRAVENNLRALTSEEADRLASDIVSVTEFYDLPIDFFLGIGAMENNYLNAPGDLEHAVWKRRAQKGDIVLKRRRGRVRVLNPSSGVWQVTRETLRYAHSLYLKDKRDYSLLPERLRPPRELDLENLNPDLLTTYAGLLFRDLLDRFDGDVILAVGAYNGGPHNPQLGYAEGVRRIADYARRMLEQAAVLHERPAAGSQFFTSK